MEELIRSRLRDALDVEPTPPHLRAQVMSSLPAAGSRARRPRPSFQLARPWVAALLALTVIAGFFYVSRSVGSLPAHTKPHAQLTPATLTSPEGVVIGPDRSVYFSDFVSGYVFRVQSDWSLVTVAGTRPAVPIAEGDAGTGGPATKAYLFGPGGLAFDRSGNLYVVDTWGQRVRRIDRHGVITTLAGTGPADPALGTFAGDGGLATHARLNNPVGIAIDGQGLIYVGDYLNGKIRRIDNRGTIVTLDESTLPVPAEEFHPGYLAFDVDGNLYVMSGGKTSHASGDGCEILRRSPAGAWSRVAGTGVCGFSGDGGFATAAEISSPGGLAFDSSANLYFADTGNHRIRRIDRNGIITTVAGTGREGYSGDGGPGTKGELQFPRGLAMSSSDTLYIAETADDSLTPWSSGRIRALDIHDGTIHTYVSTVTPIYTSG